MKKDFETDFLNQMTRLQSDPVPPVTSQLIEKTLISMKNQRAKGDVIRIPGWQLAAASVLLAVNIATGVLLFKGNGETTSQDDVANWIQTYQLNVPTIYDQALAAPEE